MRIELVAIGDELLKGRTVNTNTAFISKHLELNGYPVFLHTTLSDDKLSLLPGLKAALSRSDVVLATGGLGPTLDDGTREVAAEIFESDFTVNAAIAQELKSRYGERYFAVEDQARIPSKASILPNRVGSAVGLVFTAQGKTLILLPGVPQEMEAMFLAEALPFFKKKWPQMQKQTQLLAFCLVFESLLDPHLRILSAKYPSVEVGIYPSAGTLIVSLSSSLSEELTQFKDELCRQFSSYHYVSATGKIEEALCQAFTSRNLTLACAESCTGGRIASALTAVAGSSAYFLGSLVTYSNALKTQLLGVSDLTLASQGAVSESVVKGMLQGLFQCTQADWGLAVSGIAGPSGGTEAKPVGTVFAAIGERGKTPDVGVFKINGNREKVATTAAYCLIGALWRKVENHTPAFPLVP